MSSADFFLNPGYFGFRFPKRPVPDCPDAAPRETPKKARTSARAQLTIRGVKTARPNQRTPVAEAPAEFSASPLICNNSNEKSLPILISEFYASKLVKDPEETTAPAEDSSKVLAAEMIARLYRFTLKHQFTLELIEKGIITVSSLIGTNDYTFFEIAIFCNKWDLATKILLNNLKGEISIQKDQTLIAELKVLSWASEAHEWSFVRLFLNRDLKSEETEQLVAFSHELALGTVSFISFTPIELPQGQACPQAVIDSLQIVIETALEDSQFDVVKLILIKYLHLPACCWEKPLFHFIKKKMWDCVEKIINAHLKLVSLPCSSSSIPLEYGREFHFASILGLLCCSQPSKIIPYIRNSLDYSLFFVSFSDQSKNIESTPFCLLALNGDDDSVSYLLEGVNEDRAFDVMRARKYSFYISILGYAIESRKWSMANYIFEIYKLTQRHAHEIAQFIDEHNYPSEISSHCEDISLRETLLNYCNHYLSIYSPDAEKKWDEMVKPNTQVRSWARDEWDTELRSLIVNSSI